MQLEIARLHEAGEIAARIDVEVGEEHRVEAAEIDVHFAETHERARADVDERARDAVDEDDIARGRATKGNRAARAENGELKGRGRRGRMERRRPR